MLQMLSCIMFIYSAECHNLSRFEATYCSFGADKVSLREEVYNYFVCRRQLDSLATVLYHENVCFLYYDLRAEVYMFKDVCTVYCMYFKCLRGDFCHFGHFNRYQLYRSVELFTSSIPHLHTLYIILLC